ncbi:MAG: 5-formyltetrahydrofolate cyclo-ligase [Cyclobacteriaceae bacterium]
MTKAEARNYFRQQRKALSPQAYHLLNEAVLRRASELILQQQPGLVHCFLPILKNKEVNTWPLIDLLLEKHISVAVSRSSEHDNSMRHFLYHEKVSCQENAWGIPEPCGENLKEIREKDVDLILIPLLAFDLSGHRVGYGKGYYDRFLQQCPPKAAKIGLSLFDPVEQITDIHPADIALNKVVTPARIWTFGNSVGQ